MCQESAFTELVDFNKHPSELSRCLEQNGKKRTDWLSPITDIVVVLYICIILTITIAYIRSDLYTFLNDVLSSIMKHYRYVWSILTFGNPHTHVPFLSHQTIQVPTFLPILTRRRRNVVIFVNMTECMHFVTSKGLNV